MEARTQPGAHLLIIIVIAVTLVLLLIAMSLGAASGFFSRGVSMPRPTAATRLFDQYESLNRNRVQVHLES